MQLSPEHFSPAQAARKLGVSAKALRLYEQRGLMEPLRTSTGWRRYGPEAMARAADIVSLRALGFNLAEVGSALKGAPRSLEDALLARQNALEHQLREFALKAERVRGLRNSLETDSAGSTASSIDLGAVASVAFDLPWPWGGERFELPAVRAITYIVGPLGSGKTRLARCLAKALPNAIFLGPERLGIDGTTATSQLERDPALRRRVDHTMAELAGQGAARSDALTALLTVLVRDGSEAIVVDLIEQGLDGATQQALSAMLRCREAGARPLFLLTRSSAILDPGSVGSDEAILLCPANHSRPTLVAPYSSAPGFEAVASCLASPQIRARTEGVVAIRRAGSCRGSS